MSSEIPLVWLCGPPGVGKTAVARAVYRRLLAGGARAAYVDVDQLAMCFPEPPDDHGRHRLAARNVRALRQNFAARGAEALIVSGVVEPDRGPDRDLIGGPVIVGRLRADVDELVARLRARRGAPTDLDEAVAEAARLDTTEFADSTLDTTSLSADETVDRIFGITRGLLLRTHNDGQRQSPARAAEQVSGDVLWLLGPTGVGKSTVGFRAFLHVLGLGVPAAYVDVGQLGFFGGPRNHDLRAANLAAVWKNHHDAGAEALVAVGSIDESADLNLYERALPGATITWCRLCATPGELTRRILSRGDGGSWHEPGDPLTGQPPEALTRIAKRAIIDAANLERGDIGLRIVIDDRSADKAAIGLLAQVSWPPRADWAGAPTMRDAR